MKNFTYNITTKIYFGDDSLENIGEKIKPFSSRILITYGSDRVKTNGLFDRITEDLKKHNIHFEELSGIKANPELSSVLEGIDIIKDKKLDFILAVGGGSVIDATKAMATGAAMNINPWKICKREASVEKALPIAAVLTLSATGTEMNGNAVISNEETGEKLAFGSDFTKPVFSILDPTLTYSVPKNQTAAGVVDIFAHVAEQYFEPVSTAGITDRIAEGIMRTCIQYGRKAIDEPENYDARANLMWASTMALNELLTYGKSGGDWSTHYIEHELSAAYDVTHGVGLAIVLPQWMKYVLSEDNIERFAMFAENVWNIKRNDKFEQAKAGIEATTNFFKSIDVPTKLSEIGIGDDKIDHMAAQSTQFGEIGTFVTLNEPDVKAILKMCL